MSYRNTWIDVNLDVIDHNISYLKKVSNKEIFAVIKANGYGLGDLMIARQAILSGCEYIAVSSFDEAIYLRNNDIKANILVLGYTDKSCIEMAIKKSITLTITNSQFLDNLDDATNLKVHIKINTGMNRLGFDSIFEIKNAMCILLEKGAILEGIYTHYHSSDDPNDYYTDKQFNKFRQFVLETNYNFKWIHASNTDATIHYHESFTNAARCGISIIGVSSFDTELKCAFTLKTQMVSIRKCHTDDVVSYQASYKLSKDEYIGVIPIGYGDGFTRSNQGRNVYIHGHKQEIVGRICMDNTMLKLDKEYPLMSEVELIGEHITINEVADYCNTIPYEILTLLQERILKIYHKDNQVISTSLFRESI